MMAYLDRDSESPFALLSRPGRLHGVCVPFAAASVTTPDGLELTLSPPPPAWDPQATPAPDDVVSIEVCESADIRVRGYAVGSDLVALVARGDGRTTLVEVAYAEPAIPVAAAPRAAAHDSGPRVVVIARGVPAAGPLAAAPAAVPPAQHPAAPSSAANPADVSAAAAAELSPGGGG